MNWTIGKNKKKLFSKTKWGLTWFIMFALLFLRAFVKLMYISFQDNNVYGSFYFR